MSSPALRVNLVYIVYRDSRGGPLVAQRPVDWRLAAVNGGTIRCSDLLNDVLQPWSTVGHIIGLSVSRAPERARGYSYSKIIYSLIALRLLPRNHRGYI